MLLLLGCAGTKELASDKNRATILYFEGGGGKIVHDSFNPSSGKLINRSDRYFLTSGISIAFMNLNFEYPSYKAVSLRYTQKHFLEIQRRVNGLLENGKTRIWLMGISMGSLSVLHAATNKIQGVEGLVIINPPTMIRWGEMKKIELPILVLVHEEDGGPFKFTSNEDFKAICPSSKRPQLVTFSGGLTGKGVNATRLTQKYQHGLRGLEKKFVQTVINFIDSNVTSTTSVKQ